MMSTVAAIQMTSGHSVADNLAAAGRAVARGEGCGRGHRLPARELFLHRPASDADKLQVAEADGDGAGADILERHRARSSGCGSSAAPSSSRATRRERVANTSLLIDAARQARRALRQDSSVRRRDSRAAMSSIASRRMCMPGREPVIADTPVGQARHVRVLRHALSRALPRTGVAGRANGWRCRRRSRCRPGARTGRRCCVRGPSRICAMSWRRRRAARTPAAAKHTAIR